jgi:hypothetical protein
MLKSKERVFKAKGNRVGELQHHVSTRLRVVDLVDRVKWNFGSDDDDKINEYNRDYWKQIMVVKSGVKWSDAVNDFFSDKNAHLYKTGCKNASMMILLKAIRDAVGTSQFNTIGDGRSLEISGAAQNAGLLKADHVTKGGETPTLEEWVPGDRGYIRGRGRGLAAGEWIIYLGGDRLWGFGDGLEYPLKQTLPEWIKTVKRFSGGVANETGVRWYPSVGLEIK